MLKKIKIVDSSFKNILTKVKNWNNLLTKIIRSHVKQCSHHKLYRKLPSKSFKCYAQFNITLHALVCHSYVPVCHSNVICICSFVIRMSFICTRLSSICHSYVLVYHPYVTRMYHGDIILNRSNNSMFLRLKIYRNWKVFDLIRTSGI